MNRAAIIETLGPHLKRPIRAFLADQRVLGTEVEDAFWDAAYANVSLIEHSEARWLERYHLSNQARVESVLELSPLESREPTP